MPQHRLIQGTLHPPISRTSANRPITAYFRHTFTITGTQPVTDLILRIRRDDGAVIHLDGTELTRTNMPTGTITNTTRALSSINDQRPACNDRTSGG